MRRFWIAGSRSLGRSRTGQSLTSRFRAGVEECPSQHIRGGLEGVHLFRKIDFHPERVLAITSCANVFHQDASIRSGLVSFVLSPHCNLYISA